MCRYRIPFAIAVAALATVVAVLPARAQVVQGSNGFYDVAVDSNGDYTARTGQFHPVPRVNVFYNGATLAPNTTWNSVRSYRSNTEWLLEDFFIFGPAASPGFACRSVNNGSTRTVTSLLDGTGAQTGVRVDWAIANGTDDLVITQEVNAEGSTYESSVVRVTVCVANRGTVEAEVGIRFQWDWQIAATDGAYMGIRPPSPPVEPLLDTEQDFPNPTWDFYDMSDVIRPSVPPGPTYIVGGTVNRPILSQGPTPPELLQYASWPGIVNTCFDYATSGQVVGNSDSAVAYYWGATRATPLLISPGETYCATQYVFVFSDVPPPLCQLTPSLVGGTSCETPVRLDASASTGSACTGALEYRFLDPMGNVIEDWSTDAYSTADSNGTWTVEVRCSTDLSCTAAATADVSVERYPILDASGAEYSTCNLGVRLDWTAAFKGPTGTGVVNVYRSEVSCVDALASGPVARGITDVTYADATTVEGPSYWYVVEAEDSTPTTTCAPAGPVTGGAVTRVCIGPITDTVAAPRPEGMCWPLRVSHVVDDVTLDWSGSRALLFGEHFHVLKTVLDPTRAFVLVNAERDVTLSYSESDLTAWLQFFDVRIASECEVESADDEPPYFGGPLPTCP